jgi:DNA polymerase-3 subunit epsilon
MLLQRPIVFFDIESTGLDRANDRIVEISVVKMHNADTFKTITRRLNPGMPIPPATTAVHGITDEMVKDCPTFKNVAKALMEFLTGCDMGGYGCISFDVPMLYNEFLRAGIEWDFHEVNIIDCSNIFKQKEPRDLTAAMKFYCNAEHAGAHGAEADAMATAKVFMAQLQCYPELEAMPLSELALFSNFGHKILDLSGKFTYNQDGEIVLNFGPHRGKKAEDNLDFLNWMLSKDFPPDTVKICQSFFNYETDLTDGLPF